MYDTDVATSHERSARRTPSPRRFQIAVMLLVVFVLLSTTRVLLQSVRDVSRDDEVSVFVQHMQPVRSFLPSQGAVGYLSNITDPSAFFKAYLLTQYVLAPLVVTNIGAAPTNTPFGTLSPTASPPPSDVVVGVFAGEVPVAMLTQQHLIVVHQFTGGIVLLRKEA